MVNKIKKKYNKREAREPCWYVTAEASKTFFDFGSDGEPIRDNTNIILKM